MQSTSEVKEKTQADLRPVLFRKMEFENKEVAVSYDETFAALQPWKDSIHLCCRFILANLPKKANILCVGAGTGSELSYLAKAYPGWNFTAVEPEEAMLRICKGRAEKEGYADRCRFHTGFLDSLPLVENEFDAATSLLVSHFIVEKQERVGFFKEIAKRLKLGGRLISADLAFPGPMSSFSEHKEMWRDSFLFCGMPMEQANSFISSLGKRVAVLPCDEVAQIIADGGFDPPIQCNQNILMHTWYTNRR
mmetsp:Transcript_2166/g.2461  ORF Transcript_2166/g.2461 Transcript_2166/m.2461 type:complete len:250 (+) Transcript_2166:22-771(+)